MGVRVGDGGIMWSHFIGSKINGIMVGGVSSMGMVFGGKKMRMPTKVMGINNMYTKRFRNKSLRILISLPRFEIHHLIIWKILGPYNT